MIILVANRRRYKFKSLEFASRDFAISSICLNESVVTLKAFAKQCLVIDDKELTRLLSTPTTEIKKEYIIWEDGNVVIFAKYANWMLLNMLYALHSVPIPSSKMYQKVIAFNESRSMEMALYSNTMKVFEQKLTVHINNFYSEQIPYFNARKLVRLAKAMDINASQSKDKVLFRYKNVKYVSVEGSIFYNEIFIFIKDFKIDGFMLRFDAFDFSSYWNIPVILHPFLAVPFGFNSHLDFLPPQNYQAFAEAIHKMVTAEIEGVGFKDTRALIQDFQDLQRMWAGNKMRALERIELSKLILEKKVTFDKAE